MSTNTATNSNVYSGALTGISQFSNSNISSQIFVESIDNAISNLEQASGAANDAIMKRQIEAVARHFGDPATQDVLRSSFDDLRNWTQQRLANSDTATELGQKTLIKGFLTELGRVAGPAGFALSAAQINDAVESGNSTELGAAISSALAGAFAGWAAAALVGISGGWVAPIIAAGFAAYLASEFIAELLPEEWLDAIGDFYQDNILSPLTDFFEWADPIGIFNDVSDFFNNAFAWILRDPLTLDLDGDGIETIGADGTVLFDHDGDGIKNGTGWVSADDGILVLDRDGNGTIDNGRELFGDSTLKSDGTTARDGFDALSDLDSNADGLVDANDAEFSNLQVWRDLNTDGISQADELFTLSELGIQSIGTTSEVINENLGNGNVATAEGSFTYTDGSTGKTGTAANLDLAANNFYREFPDAIEIPEELEYLPDLAGSGAVRDLKEAAVLSSSLASLLDQYSQASTKAEQLALIDELLQTWADSSNFNKLVNRIDDAVLPNGVYTLKFRITDPDYDGQNQNAAYFDDEELKVGAFADRQNVDVLAKIQVLEVFNDQAFFDFNLQEEDDDNDGESDTFIMDAVTGNTSRRVSRSISAFLAGNDIFIDETDLTLSQPQMDFIDQSYDALKNSVYQGLLFQTRFKKYVDAFSLSIIDGNLGLDASDADQLLLADFLADPVNTIHDIADLVDFSPSSIANVWSPAELLSEILEDVVITTEIQGALDVNDIVIVDSNVASYVAVEEEKVRTIIGNDLDNSIVGSLNAEQIYGVAGNDTIDAEGGDDKLYGGAGNDIINGDAGDDLINGGEGDDTLDGGAGTDTLNGGAGDDILGGASGSLDFNGSGNIYEGGAGNDTLRGSKYGDIYHFNLGDGQDTLLEYGGTSSSSSYTDVLQFGAGIDPSEMSYHREGEDLVLSHSNGADGIRFVDWFKATTRKYQVERLEFADPENTVWLSADITAELLVQNGTENADTLEGVTAYSDTLFGLDGDDMLSGLGGDDLLDGGEGDDTLDGGSGADTLIGGAGDDILGGASGSPDFNGSGNTYYGGMGNDTLRGSKYGDTYHFNLGDGQDTLLEYGGTSSSSSYTDVLQFGAGIDPSDISYSRVGEDLVLSHNNGVDGIRFVDWFRATTRKYQVERLEFADAENTVWLSTDIAAALLVQSGTENADTLEGLTAYSDTLFGLGGDDVLSGLDGDDLLNGGEGDDTLDGGAGADTLIGGAGDDILGGASGSLDFNGVGNTYDGGAGNDTLRGSKYGDTYHFSLGDGQDTLLEYGGTSSSSSYTDVLKFGAGIDPSDISYSREGEDLVLSHSNGVDGITFVDWFKAATRKYQVEQLVFADAENTVWLSTDITAALLVQSGTENADILEGLAAYSDVLLGLGGDDILSGLGGDDYLDGGEGNDTLDGGSGSDTFLGGAGDDILGGASGSLDFNGSGNTYEGGVGNDTLRGSKYGDTYHFNLGDGQDTLLEYGGTSSSSSYTDVLQFGAGIDPSDISYSREGEDLVLSHSNGVDGMTIVDWFKATTRKYQVERLEFADAENTVWLSTDITAALLVQSGTENADTLEGLTAYSDTLFGLGGDDVLSGLGGDDYLDGGEGNDTLDGGSGSDTFVGGAGDDILGGAYGSLDYKGSGNTYDGGAGNDTLLGSKYGDTYHFDLGDGQDTLLEYGGTSSSSSYTDVLQFGAGIDPSDISYSRVGEDLVLSHNNGVDGLTLVDWFRASTRKYQVERLEFADAENTVWLSSDITAALLVQSGTENADTLEGVTAYSDTLLGLDGDDVLSGLGGDDYLDGGEGNDTLDGGSGSDTFVGGAGDDILGGAYGSLDYKGSGNTYDGGTGNDTLRGSKYGDTYHFNLGDGQDVIIDSGSSSKQDELLLAGIDEQSIWLTQIGDDLVLDYIGTDDRITISDWFLSSSKEIEKISANGSDLLASQVDQLVQAMAAISSGEPSDLANLTAQQQDDLSTAIAAAWS